MAGNVADEGTTALLHSSPSATLTNTGPNMYRTVVAGACTLNSSKLAHGEIVLLRKHQGRHESAVSVQTASKLASRSRPVRKRCLSMAAESLRTARVSQVS